MPPKGWKKSLEPSLLHEEVELVSIDDILFPRATIAKSIKSILDTEDEKMTLSKDSLIAIQRSATVFVSHLQFHARLIAKHNNRKNVYASDILAGMEYAGFAGFVPRVKQLLATYEEDVSATRRKKAVEKESGVKLEPEPVAKKAKVDPAEEPLEDILDEIVDESDDDDEVVEVVEDAEAMVVDDNDEEDEGDDEDEEDATKKNPIALLNKEEKELEGVEPEEPQHEADSEDESS